MSDRPHKKLTKCHVLFLGDSTPKQSSQGLEALQQPLMTCYPVDKHNEVEGIDSWLTIFTSGILLQFVGTKTETPTPIWFPIQNLHIAAATKCVNYLHPETGQRMETEFVDINNEMAQKSSHPPLFSIIVRKASGKRILRCYTFLVREEAPAVAMVDAVTYAYSNRSGWSSNHPPQEIIHDELLLGQTVEDTDEIDEFDSVSAAGRREQQDPASSTNMTNAYNDSIHDTPASKAFPYHLARKYTLTNTNRGYSTSPARRPIPPEFIVASANNSIRSGRHVVRNGPPLPPYMRADLEGSLRATSSVRVIRDPRTRTSVIEKVIRQPVPVPVYQPPPPPQIIREPVFVRQPPEIRHVNRHIPVPVEVPVPFPAGSDSGRVEDSWQHSRSNRYTHKKSHNTFKNYQVYDERILRSGLNERPTFFTDPHQPFIHNGYPIQMGYGPVESHHRSRTHRRHHESRRKKSRGSSSDSSLSDNGERGFIGQWTAGNPYRYRNGIEITELHSPDDKSEDKQARKGKYGVRELEKELGDYHIKEVEPRNKNENEKQQSDFQWRAVSKEEKKTEKKRKKEKQHKDVVNEPDYDKGQVYVGADPVSEQPNRNAYRSSFQAYKPEDVDVSPEERKKKDKKNRDRIPRKLETAETEGQASTSKEYYFKEATSQAPRNWMDEQKEHMNERAFSSSLANDPPQEGTNAYALNTAIDEEDMFHKPMPGLRPPGAIPVPPPIPDHLKLNIGGGKATDLY